MIVVFDLEQFSNFHSCFAININSEQEFYFEISDFRDDRNSYQEFLDNCKGMIGFNNLNYDYPLLEKFMQHRNLPAHQLCRKLYKEGQSIIKSKWGYPEWKIKIPQLDLFKIYHFDNRAKSTSLKSLQVAMNWENVQDLPFKFDHHVSNDEREEIKKYNRNDVLSTFEFYKKSRKVIDLRKDLSKQYKINCRNWNDSKIGEQILIQEVCRLNKVHPQSLTPVYNGEKINIKDIFVKYSIQNKEIQQEKEKFAKLSLTNEEFKGSIVRRLVYEGFPFDFGAGGLHGSVSSQVIVPAKDEKIKSSDVSSYYPNLAASFGFYIRQCGEKYIDVIKKLYHMKQTSSGSTRAAVKLALVSIFGKSNDQYSKLFDPKYFLSTTINGQLLLADLHLSLIKAGFKPLLLNTDGLEFLIKSKDENKYMQICDKWAEDTGLILEHEEYERLCIKDVNNYIGKFTTGEVKQKGDFQVEKDWHKDPSFKIIPIALEQYFIYDKPVEEIVKNHNNIFDFCGRVKSNSGYKIKYHYLDNSKEGTLDLQKTNRVYLSNSGGYLYKSKGDRSYAIYKGEKITVFNQFEDKQEYDINYSWYIKEVQKIIDIIEPKQMSLF